MGDHQCILWVTERPDTGFEESFNSSGLGTKGLGESDCSLRNESRQAGRLICLLGRRA
jgi:hypothetical protein